MFSLPDLPYPYSALEPYIDAQTLEIHHTKHHAAYVKNLNEALTELPGLAAKDESDLQNILSNLTNVPESVREKVRNHGGGHLNHTLFWSWMTLKATPPSPALISRLDTAFGTFDAFKDKFSQAALTHFGSGWAWLVAKDQKLTIITTPNQDSPLSTGFTPILGLDVWEHAYYLKYQNRRADYISAWINVINWPEVEKHLVSLP